MEDELFTTQQVASSLGVSDTYVRKMIAQGKATPKGRVGNIYVFTRTELERLLNRPKGKRGGKRS